MESVVDTGGAGSIHVVDLDNGSTQDICWPSTLDDVDFEHTIETQLREKFGVSDEAYVDLIDLETSMQVFINRESLLQVRGSLCLALAPRTLDAWVPLKNSEVFDITFTQEALGLRVKERNDCMVVEAFNGDLGHEGTDMPTADDIIYRIQGARTVGRSYDDVVRMLQLAKARPLKIHFFRPFPRDGLYAVEFRSPILGMEITHDEENVIVGNLPLPPIGNVLGYAETHGVHTYDILHAIDGTVVRGLQYDLACDLLGRAERPKIVVFARSGLQQRQLTPRTRASSGSISQLSRGFAVLTPSPGRSRGTSCASGRSTPTSVGGGTEGSIGYGMAEDGSLSVEETVNICNSVHEDGYLTREEGATLVDMVLAGRQDVFCAARYGLVQALVAIVRSPSTRRWDMFLLTNEQIVLAGPVTIGRTSTVYDLILTDQERLIVVQQDTLQVIDEIKCASIITVSSRTKKNELILTTHQKGEYVFVDTFIGPIVWVRAILPYTCTQGTLKVGPRKLFGTKKRFFVLQGSKFVQYKKESAARQAGAKSTSMSLTDDTWVEVVDAKRYRFAICTPEFQVVGKKLLLGAPSKREYQKWMLALAEWQKIDAEGA